MDNLETSGNSTTVLRSSVREGRKTAEAIKSERIYLNAHMFYIHKDECVTTEQFLQKKKLFSKISSLFPKRLLQHL